MNSKRIARALIAGAIATIAMTGMAYFVAPMMLGHPMDIAQMLAGFLGVNWTTGMLMHLTNGIVVFPLFYLVLADRLLPGPPWLKGLLLALGLWFVLEAGMLPMIGAGFFNTNRGGPKAVLAALMAHLVYGTLLGSVIGNVTELASLGLKERPT